MRKVLAILAVTSSLIFVSRATPEPTPPYPHPNEGRVIRLVNMPDWPTRVRCSATWTWLGWVTAAHCYTTPVVYSPDLNDLLVYRYVDRNHDLAYLRLLSEVGKTPNSLIEMPRDGIPPRYPNKGDLGIWTNGHDREGILEFQHLSWTLGETATGTTMRNRVGVWCLTGGDMIEPGDSGGGVFIDGRVAGIVKGYLPGGHAEVCGDDPLIFIGVPQ